MILLQLKKQKNPSGNSKKSRSPTRSRSPVSKSSSSKKKISEVTAAVSDEMSPADSHSEVSPQPPAEPVITKSVSRMVFSMQNLYIFTTHCKFLDEKIIKVTRGGKILYLTLDNLFRL